MSRAIVFTSGKGGVGKSTLTFGVGKALAELGTKVVLVDTDIGLNNLDVLMGVEQKVVYDITDVINNRCRLTQALVEQNGLYLLPSSKAYEQCRADGQSFREIVMRLKNGFDYVLIDCPAGIEYGFHRSVSCSDEAIVVTSFHLSALKDAAKVIRLIESYRLPARLIVNRVRGDMILSGEALSVEEISSGLHVNVLGAMPESDDINLVSLGGSLKRSEGLSALRIIANNIHYGGSEIYDATKKYRGFFGNIKRKIRGRI